MEITIRFSGPPPEDFEKAVHQVGVQIIEKGIAAVIIDLGKQAIDHGIQVDAIVRPCLPMNSIEHVVAERDRAWKIIGEMRQAWSYLMEETHRIVDLENRGDVLKHVGTFPDVMGDDVERLVEEFKRADAAMKPQFGKYEMVDQLMLDSIIGYWTADHPGHGKGLPVGILGAAVEGLAARQEFEESRPKRQVACELCTQGVMDNDGPAGPGNDHMYGRCKCACHAKEAASGQPQPAGS